ncbi:hypothetical protein WR25_13933 [Diploscapter pachys]|uniref:EGF-like domain-containing protein n=1 Tax=Diploscapter pachys TaxID=2018661 RepID=A0A2A2LGK9_9BILA|nr:hypothetical protein WR25_13933 [Diploscapter pachys]
MFCRYECKCASGYVLDKDGHSCKLDNEQEGFLYLSLGFEVRSMPMFNAASKNSVYDTMHKLDKHGFARSIDYSTADQTVFMAIDMNNNEGEIGALKDGIFNVLRENVTGVGYVAVDWTQGNIYFTQKYPAPRPGISVCTREGFFCRQIIPGQPADLKDGSARQSYRGLALHPQAGRLVWIDSYRSTYKIMAANLDGTNVHPLVENKLPYPSGLAVDPIRNEIYFGDVEEMLIERVDMHGANR